MSKQELSDWDKARLERILSGRSTGAPLVATPPAGVDQKALVSSHHLPREIDSLEPITWEELSVRWGMKVLGSLKANFFAVQMPPGWYLQGGGEESLWSYLLDDRGRERATIYYQPNFSDRSAILYLSRRYSVFSHYLDPTDTTVRIISARDGRRIFHEFGRVVADHAGYFKEVTRIEECGKLWMDTHFPQWQDPFAYWDEQP